MAEYSHPEAFQSKILALYVQEPKRTYGIIEPEFFQSPIHLEICRLAKQLYTKHDVREARLSKETLLAVVKGYLGHKRADVWPEYKRVIRHLFEEKLADHTVIYEQAFNFARERKYRRALVQAEQDINNGNYEGAHKRFDALKGFGAERDLGINYWDNPTDPTRWSTDRHGIIGTFYLPTLDKLMGGGLGAGELAIILASAKRGKTSLLGRFAAGALWHNKNVAIATGELSDKKYRKRIDAMVTSHSTSELTRLSYMLQHDKLSHDSKKAVEDVMERMRLAHGQMKGNLYIKQWPTNKGKIRDIENWLDQIKEDKGIDIDILFVDYIRVFRPNEKYDEQRMSVGQVALDLRGIAVERNIPVWTAQQTNRAAMKKERLEPSDIAEDISQFWTLDFLIAFCQTEQEIAAGEKSKHGRSRPEKGRMYLMAGRDVSSGGVVPVFIHRDTFSIREQEAEKI